MKRTWNDKLISWRKKLIYQVQKQAIIWLNENRCCIRVITFIYRFVTGTVFSTIKKIGQWGISWLKSCVFWELTISLIFVVSGFVWLFWNSKEQETVRNLILLIAGIIGWYFLARRTRAAEQDAKTAKQSLTVDLFTRSIEQLDNERSPVRLGGVLGLEQIADTHEGERQKIARVLLSFVRIRAAKNSKEVRKNLAVCGISQPGDVDEFSAYRMQRLDIEAAVNALARIASKLERQGQFREQYNENKYHLCDLQDVDLRGLRFVETDLSRFCLAGTDLSGAWMAKSNLTQAILRKVNSSGKPSAAKLVKTFLDSANLSGAFLENVDFSDAQLKNTNFSNTRLYKAVFVKAYLLESNFSKAQLVMANLTEAYLEKANLNCAILIRATLDNAILDEATLKSTLLRGATLNDTSFYDAIGLTQEQLSEARCERQRSPRGLPSKLMQTVGKKP